MGKMPLIVLSLSLLCFTVNANSQGCVEETLDCNKAVPTVFKLSDASCPCDDASHSGVLKFSDNEVHVCAGTEWNMVHLIKEVSGPYGSEGNPGQFCDDIYDELVKGSTPEDGIYWLRFPLPGNACIHYTSSIRTFHYRSKTVKRAYKSQRINMLTGSTNVHLFRYMKSVRI